MCTMVLPKKTVSLHCDDQNVSLRRYDLGLPWRIKGHEEAEMKEIKAEEWEKSESWFFYR